MNTKYHTRNTQRPVTLACQRRLLANFKLNTLPGSREVVESWLKQNNREKDKNNLLKIVLVLSVCFFNFGCVQRSDYKSNDVLKMKELTANGLYDQSIILGNRLLNNNHKDLQVLRQLGIAYFDLSISDSNMVNFRDSAKSIFNQMIMIDTSNIFALKSLGIVFYDEGICDSSIFFLSKALSLKTIDGTTYFNEASQVNDFDIDSQYLRFLRARSAIYLKCNLKGAIEDVRSCIDEGYKLKQSYLLGGILSYAFDLKEQSCNFLEEAKKLGNEDADFYLDQFCSK